MPCLASLRHDSGPRRPRTSGSMVVAGQPGAAGQRVRLPGVGAAGEAGTGGAGWDAERGQAGDPTAQLVRIIVDALPASALQLVAGSVRPARNSAISAWVTGWPRLDNIVIMSRSAPWSHVWIPTLPSLRQGEQLDRASTEQRPCPRCSKRPTNCNFPWRWTTFRRTAGKVLCLLTVEGRCSSRRWCLRRQSWQRWVSAWCAFARGDHEWADRCDGPVSGRLGVHRETLRTWCGRPRSMAGNGRGR